MDCPQLQRTAATARWRGPLIPSRFSSASWRTIGIQYTSGTTGAPKGATLTHHGLVNNAILIADLLRYTEQDRVCTPVPFYHCFGHVAGILTCAAVGACLMVPSEAFDAEAVLEAVHEERCTSLYGVPTMFIAELAYPRFAELDLTSLRTGIMAGAPCPVEIMKRVDSFPMTVTGKIQKFRMREIAIEELQLEHAAAVVTA